MERYVILEKTVGETPLECLERFRATRPDLANVPMAYAGRLDPLASGKLLVLIGEECKHQQQYHGLDKAYEVEILLGVGSDSGDVLGLITEGGAAAVSFADCRRAARSLTGALALPYPIFSSKTVRGKPLHTWAVEGTLDEIEIPICHSFIYKFRVDDVRTINRTDLHNIATAKIAAMPTVTDERKALGNDFRRAPVLEQWDSFHNDGRLNDRFTVIQAAVTASSGTYMRSLAAAFATELGTHGLALSIHRTTIGRYQALGPWGFWQTRYE